MGRLKAHAMPFYGRLVRRPSLLSPLSRIGVEAKSKEYPGRV